MKDISTLIKENGLETPFYLIDENELLKNIRELKNALSSHWDNYLIGYSFKTNSVPWLLDYFRKENFYAEVVSDDEYDLAKAVNFEKHKIIYNGPAKSKETFIEAITNGCIVNIDSQREIQWLKDLEKVPDQIYEVGIRVNFNIESCCPHESAMGNQGGRFGFCFENGELEKAMNALNAIPNVRLAGLHLHCSSKTRSLCIYKAIAQAACEIKQRYSLNVKYIDIGGGFYGGLEGKPRFDDYLQTIETELIKQFNKSETILILEPGTSLVSSPISFITSVTDVKSTTLNHFIVTDGSRNNVDPLFKKNKYFYRVELKSNNVERTKIHSQVISGYTCMEDDRLFVLSDHEQLMEGDLIVYEKVGAYTICLSPLFIKYFPSIYGRNLDHIYKIRDKWDAQKYIDQE